MTPGRWLAAAAAGALVACGGGGGGGGGSAPPSEPEPPPPPAVIDPVDGPPWRGFAGNAQHTSLGAIATQPLAQIVWRMSVDLAPQYSGSGALLAHYGSPVITRRNTVLVPVKTGAAGGFRVDARIGVNGARLWMLDSDYRLPPHSWVPSFNPVLASDTRLVMPAAGGRVLMRDDADAASGSVSTVAFYGNTAYAADPAAYDNTVMINTPLTADAQGNVFFGFSITGANPAGLTGGIARVAADGSGTWVTASTAAADAEIVKPAMNSAPALSADGRTLYVVLNNVPAAGTRARGQLVALDSTTLATVARRPLLDPATGTPAWVSDNGTASPTVGPDGDVYIGVLEAGSHNRRGWLLHFDAGLLQERTPASFGWDITASVVPASMLPSYSGPSSYLLAIKYNNYGGIGTGDGRNRVAVVDPRQTQPDPIIGSVLVMREILTMLGPTPDPAWPGGVREWCINTAAVDPLTSSILINNEDGLLYRWHLPSNTFSESIRLNSGYAQAYTPTLIGPDGRVYAVNNAVMFSIGR
jgi:hypothetical protein